MVERYVESLKPALVEAVSRVEQAEAEHEATGKRLDEARQDKERVERAIAILKGEDGKKKKRRRRGSGASVTGDWTPSEDIRAEVARVVFDNEGGVTVADIEATLDGRSRTAIDRTLRYLRDDHGPDQPPQVRLAGKRGQASLYKPVRSVEELIPSG